MANFGYFSDTFTASGAWERAKKNLHGFSECTEPAPGPLAIILLSWERVTKFLGADSQAFSTRAEIFGTSFQVLGARSLASGTSD
uniref:Uncharacterized protein n=1 Tax=Candidatus Kentrum sp. UNK TaxID=2126344 RepID=A0A451B147_9GAMM|nr:MAG: hypothetical protein BECKUNK1418H_GA0071006_10911 [Candidatus Kentron sp. UNK]